MPTLSANVGVVYDDVNCTKDCKMTGTGVPHCEHPIDPRCQITFTGHAHGSYTLKIRERTKDNPYEDRGQGEAWAAAKANVNDEFQISVGFGGISAGPKGPEAEIGDFLVCGGEEGNERIRIDLS